VNPTHRTAGAPAAGATWLRWVLAQVFTPSRRMPAILALAALPCALRAQQLAPVSDAEHCHGELITEVTAHGARRAVLAEHAEFAPLVNGAMRRLQPLTPGRVVRNFVLLRAGDRCDEARRADSERILRAQPYISAAAIRAEPVGRDSVRLVVETIDEYMIFAEAWGLGGVPLGGEVGTGNLFDGARAVSLTGELGRGDALGGGIKFTDYQAFGEPLQLSLNVASRPLARYSSASLVRPFYTDFQPYAWLTSVSQTRFYYAFHETGVGSILLDYQQQSWAVGGLRRWPHDERGFQVGAVATGTYSDPIAPVMLGVDGPVPVSAPEILARYHSFSDFRVGVAVGYRDMRFMQVAGLSDLSATQDFGLGWQVTAMVLQGIGVFPATPPDQVGVLNLGFGAGSQFAQIRGGFEVEARTIDGSTAPVTTLGSGAVVATLKTSLAHTTLLDLEIAGGANARIPMQLTFRDDDGLLGYRSTDVGGGQRTIWRFEDRWLVPSPLSTAEFAVALLAQAGKLDAGDALYGVTTPWQYGAGFAVMAGIPRGSKHMVRLEFGWPLNPIGPRQMEFRISYGDHSAANEGAPGAIYGAREAQTAARAVTP
jgi:hypothetical protein